MTTTFVAAANREALRRNSYPGRGIVVGLDTTGDYAVQVYWIMGRSENSRNRIFVDRGGGAVETAPFDPSKVKDPSLIIYQAMAESHWQFAVSNGAQTTDAVNVNNIENDLDMVLVDWQHEPDAPNFTPRITAVVDLGNSIPLLQISLLKKSPFDRPVFGTGCDRQLFRYELAGADRFGYGHCVTTYSGDGNPLPAFQGEPYLLPFVPGGAKEIAEDIWSLLNEDNRVALVTKLIEFATGDVSIHIINKLG